MSKLRPLDPAFPIERQLAVDASPVVLMNIFTVDKADEQALVEAWQDDALFMKQQPGFISTQLHRAIGAKVQRILTTQSGKRLLTFGPRSRIQHSRQSFPLIRRRP